jgi:hypothetical protein
MTNGKTRCLWLAGSLLLSVCHCVLAADDQASKPARLFEMRIYTTHPGKLPDLHRRFRDHTNRIFQSHGIQLVGYWTPAEGDEAENTLVYILAYPSREAREKSWKEFAQDPQWKKAREESEKNGPIVKRVESKFLTPTDYSPLR